ncbi:MAG: cytochrome c oxidase subunit II [Betaproteobacteria bacterium RIFCSPLOWO2_12_FULL_62_58]|nr:MAG: cytochrome c oxidase subunit II [Betaproteobacteria bacterium RIFCSPLOWO2_02_FULL_62_79]OGA48014.1 MAG: cytochrome c oxidase subunit II [Betaproteobacteria bacterium RIFCSPLOWO2_12_FULL_62_58]
MTSKLARLFAAATAFLAAGTACANQYNLQPPQTIIAHEIYDLHTLIMWIIVGIFVVVFGAMTYAIVKHRKSVGHKAEQFHENTMVEIVWTVIPFLILIGMAYPATKTVISMKDTSSPDMTIKATGYQWKWGYDYLQEGVSFYSSLATPRDQIEGRTPKGTNYLLEVDNPVVVPVGKKVRIIITANDVIHSWWVPALGVKQDAIPGFVRDSWFKVDKPGTYRGQCAELCGKDHGFMPIVVEAVEPEKYAAWVKEQKEKMAKAAVADAPDKPWTLDDLKARGEKIYGANCIACHQATGMGVPGAFPALSGSKIVTGPKDGQINVLLNGVVKDGKPTAMVSFKQLSDVELAAVITYTRNNWDNKTGEAIMPADVKALRK